MADGNPVISADIAIVGAGAAGLATAIFAARANPALRIALLDGAKKPGAKILVSGGGRCNVTNVTVRETDFCGGSPHLIKRVLRAFSVQRTVEFFREIGVELYEDYAGKLFPQSDSARTVLDALLCEVERRNIALHSGQRVTAIERDAAQFRITTHHGLFQANRLVLATGGMSLPKTGSDGAGYVFARALGHTFVPPIPALVPLTLGGDFHTALSGIAHDVEMIVRSNGQKPIRHAGALLWTHFGISGPAVLDVSRHWHRAKAEGRAVTVSVNLLPGHAFESAEKLMLDATAQQPRTHLANLIATWIPARVGELLLQAHGIAGGIPLAHLPREQRRRLLIAMLDFPLAVTGSKGFAAAEVTAGGVPLSEIDAATMQSKSCPGLYLVGEILDCDGRIGGFNFQWAWSTGFIAGQALAREHE